MSKENYKNINQLKDFLEQDEIKKLIDNNKLIDVLEEAYLSKYHIEDLINDLIYLFLYTQDKYTPNCWAIKTYHGPSCRWVFIHKDNIIQPATDINDIEIYSSFEEANEALKEIKYELQNNPKYTHYKLMSSVYLILGLIE